MATLLELVNDLRAECGIRSAPLTTLVGPLSGEATRCRNWIIKADLDIQRRRPDWKFLRIASTFQTVAGQGDYTGVQAGIAAGELGDWKRDSYRASTLGQAFADEQIVNFLPWDTFRNLYRYGNMRTQTGRPVLFAVRPDKSLAFGPVPDQVYVVDFEYWRTPRPMVLETDEPLIPSQFQAAIVYRAMQFYASYEAAPEVMERGLSEFRLIYNELTLDQAPEITFAAPLA